MNKRQLLSKNPSVKVSYSTINDGIMKFGYDGVSDSEVVKNREKFLQKTGIASRDTTLCKITYESDLTYDRILDLNASDKSKGMRDESEVSIADALFTKEARHGLFLPLADCGGIVVHDTKRKVLGLLHLGRHATFDNLAEKAIEHMSRTYDTDSRDVHIWISPSISGESYLLQTFDKANDPLWQPFIKRKDDGWLVDLQGYNMSRFIAAGVPSENIEHSGIDTATHPDFPSHYAYSTLGQPEKAGRFAVVAYMQ